MPQTRPGSTADTVTVILLDDDRVTETPHELAQKDFDAQIHVGGLRYEHVDDAADGCWRFAPSR